MCSWRKNGTAITLHTVATTKNQVPVATINRRPQIVVGFVILLIVAVMGFVSFTRQKHLDSSSIAANSSSTPFALTSEIQTYATYAGSASCKECHEEAYALWARSHHGLAERLLTSKEEDAAFDPAQTFRHGTQPTSVRKTRDHYELVSAGLRNTQEVFKIDRVIGESTGRIAGNGSSCAARCGVSVQTRAGME